MKVKVYKSLPAGDLIAPPSKSYSHRYLIAAMLANCRSRISNIYYSNDVLATLDCLSSFGCDFVKDNDGVDFYESDIKNDNPIFNCNESGSTLRFMIPVALTKYEKATFKGTKKLISRGIEIYEEIFKKQNIKVHKEEDSITIEGKLQSGEFEIDGSISSQYISGLLFALPLLDGDSVIKLLPPVNSKNYIDITLDVLRKYQIAFEQIENTIFIKGNQKYVAKDFAVEGDYSNAAFLEAFNYFGGKIKVHGLNKSSLQGDKVFADYFEKLNNENITLDISNCIDLGPVLMMFAALKNGGKFIGTKRLKIKESNRDLAMQEELKKVGIKSGVFENEVEIFKGKIERPKVSFNSHNDHRIVMSLSLLSTLFDIEISGAEAVEKSYPNFFNELEKVGVKIEYETE